VPNGSPEYIFKGNLQIHEPPQPAFFYNPMCRGLAERCATVAHFLLKLKGPAWVILHDIADDIPGGVECVVEALSLASIAQHIFPKGCLQLCLPSYSSLLFDLVPHRRDENDTGHRVLAAQTLEHAEIHQRCARHPVGRDVMKVHNSRQLDVLFITSIQSATERSTLYNSLTFSPTSWQLRSRRRYLRCTYHRNQGCR